MASALLGTEPPKLPGRLLVALTREFGIAPGTARVALSRMVDQAELTNNDGVYHLAGPLLARRERQARGQAASVDPQPWDGQWEMAVVSRSGRSGADRTALRKGLAALGLAERREGVWLRPANLAADRLASERMAVADQVEWYRTAPDTDGAQLAAQLWDLPGWSTEAHDLIAQLAAPHHTHSLAEGFVLSAAVLRHFVHDPQLPRQLWPPDWPAAQLRDAYRGFDTAYRQQLRTFFATVK